MTQTKLRKERIDLTIEQKLDDAKLMVHERYTNKKIMVLQRGIIILFISSIYV
jgi:hypothetical protein